MIRATKDYLFGRWLLVRIIENVPEGIVGEVWGQAQVVEDGEGLTCREEGVLRFGGADYHTDRTSLWRFPQPGRVEVRYADDRPFHDFLTRDPIALLIDDEVVYDFEPGTWISRWQMLGPARNYMMTSRHRR